MHPKHWLVRSAARVFFTPFSGFEGGIIACRRVLDPETDHDGVLQFEQQ
jgi:hypothetical protein